MNSWKEEQIDTLRNFLLSGITFSKAVDMVAKDFGDEVSIEQISKFWDSECVPHLLRNRRKAAATAEEVAREATATPDRFDDATLALLKQRVFEMAMSPQMKVSDVKDLVSLILKAHEQSLRVRDQQFKEEKWKEAHGTIENTALSEEQRAARLKEIFGIV